MITQVNVIALWVGNIPQFLSLVSSLPFADKKKERKDKHPIQESLFQTAAYASNIHNHYFLLPLDLSITAFEQFGRTFVWDSGRQEQSKSAVMMPLNVPGLLDCSEALSGLGKDTSIPKEGKKNQ